MRELQREGKGISEEPLAWISPGLTTYRDGFGDYALHRDCNPSTAPCYDRLMLERVEEVAHFPADRCHTSLWLGFGVLMAFPMPPAPRLNAEFLWEWGGVSLSLDPKRTLRNLPAPALKAVKSCLFVGDNPSGFRGFCRIRSVSARRRRRLPILKAVEVLPQAVGNGSVVSWRYISVLDRNDCSEEKLQASVAIQAPKWAA